ncbi:helix-turn-helix domain-containing protein [Sporomusa acidovorans]|uniref:Cytoskeleton protein RodZ n=1 Tax=Sporomusa acidovorans (strain ATCC 49682 / DSM 3132 / Mol) TaxID=1123286 RepID=A0ABZ3J2N0_SPOA4|nr:RodZ domain-containing protein [Sporomusa acidovorans]OZC20135.1 cytoskeleton protein RodZ [Sporomusa acidovorans DSM 3132]SDD44120.1 protein RodZ, contains Xre-like HTH and DUF4115 domains [Sporomusa acidovorans]
MQTVGEFLREERLKKALSVKDVESAISIRALYLNAIEEGNYAIIPGEVYLKGFIRNYATFLGLDPQAVMELYRQNKGQTKEEVPAVNPPQEPVPMKSPSNGGGLTKWVVGIVLVVLIAAGLAWWSAGSEQPAPTPPAQNPPPAATQQQTPAKVQEGTQPAPANPVANKVVVTAKYSAQCWTQIVADGKEIYEGTPKNGESLTWEATNKLSIKFGNAGVVDLVYNGKPMGKIGNNGEVVVKTFTQAGIQ